MYKYELEIHETNLGFSGKIIDTEKNEIVGYFDDETNARFVLFLLRQEEAKKEYKNILLKEWMYVSRFNIRSSCR